MQDYRKPKQAMEARREKRRGRGRRRKTWEDCVIDVARRKGKTLADMKRLARDGIAFREWIEDPKLQGNRDKEEEEEQKMAYFFNSRSLSALYFHFPRSDVYDGTVGVVNGVKG
jgi:hypothetical protein